MKKITTKPVLLFFLSLGVIIQAVSSVYAADEYPIVFTTQVPIPTDFATIGSTFANHTPRLQSVGRGGDLWIRYTDGSLKNLTKAAGFGDDNAQGVDAIAVRDPAVNWEGNKVIFSMVVGAPSKQYDYKTYFWQLYEITNLGKDETPVINKVSNQPTSYNNISPLYGQDDRIIFTSDRPFKGLAHLYPQLDEYESHTTVSGLWSLNPQTADLFMLTHSPSGDFTPIIDSFGRVVFTRWDHLKRDQQADSDFNGERDNGPINWSSESVNATSSNNEGRGIEIFPEPRSDRPDLLAGTNLRGHNFNHFFPWMVNEDGTQLETLNHIGRHELHSYFDKSMNGDDNLQEFIGRAGTTNENSILNFLQIQEDPTRSGVYVGIDAPEFDTHSSGQMIELEMPSGMNPDNAQIIYLTPRVTKDVTESPAAEHTGHYRDPLPLSNGKVIASHTAWTGGAGNRGTRSEPKSDFDFRLKFLTKSNGSFIPGTPLTNGIKKDITYWDPDIEVSYSENLWELHPVELRPRTRPNQSIASDLEAPETSAFSEAGVSPTQFKGWLKANDLALIVSRNVTSRDAVDTQQPLNLKITGSDTKSIASTGKVYDISHLQIFQGDMVRGYNGNDLSGPGRRVIAQPLHDDLGKNPSNPTGPIGSVKLGDDGSMAALVPARRALSWQLTDDAGEAVVRERVWLNFAAGEVRVCTSCHGINSADQTGKTEPANKPQALVNLLKHWSLTKDNPVITMIDVVGRIQASAETAITKVGLVLGTITSESHATVVSGRIISSNPAAGASIDTGSAVTLVVSTGSTGVADVTIPNVIGQTKVVATTALEVLSLTVTTALESSNTVVVGLVIRSTPEAGSIVNAGSSVNLVISTGSSSAASVTVPDVIDQIQVAATSALEVLGLTVTTFTENSEAIAIGMVIKSIPDAGSTVDVGSTVNLVISTGPSPVGTVTVPNVLGQTKEIAKSAVEVLGLKVTTSLESSTVMAAGLVIKSEPNADSEVSSGSTVNLVISTGMIPVSNVTVPDVLDQRKEAAAATLEGLGLEITTSSESSDMVAVGMVISSYPKAGSTVDAGSAINLVISTGPVTTTGGSFDFLILILGIVGMLARRSKRQL